MASAPYAELAPSEIWDIVKVLNDKLKSAREQLESSEKENEELKSKIVGLEDGSDEAQQVPVCDKKTCIFAQKAKQLRGEIKNLKLEGLKEIKEREERIAELEKQLIKHSPNDAEIVDPDDPSEYRSQMTIPQANTKPRSYSQCPVDPHTVAATASTVVPGSNPEVTLPDWSSLSPCLLVDNKDPDPTLHIPKNILSQSKCNPPLYCHQSILWNSEAPDQAYLVKPESLFSPLDKGHEWKRNTPLDDLVGQSREIFYFEGGRAHYAGTYKMLRIDRLQGSDQKHIPDTLLRAARRDSLFHTSERLSPRQKSLAYNTIHADYHLGKVHLACLVMQYVGFNTGLYEDLVKRFAARKLVPGTTPRKRPLPTKQTKQSNKKMKLAHVKAEQSN